MIPISLSRTSKWVFSKVIDPLDLPTPLFPPSQRSILLPYHPQPKQNLAGVPYSTRILIRVPNFMVGDTRKWAPDEDSGPTCPLSATPSACGPAATLSINHSPTPPSAPPTVDCYGPMSASSTMTAASELARSRERGQYRNIGFHRSQIICSSTRRFLGAI